MSKDMLGVSVYEARGVVADLLEKLGGQDGVHWLSAAKRFLRKESPWPAGAGLISSTFVRDMTNEKGWELKEDVSESSIISIADLELVPILNDGENSVSGKEMMKRAKKLNAMLGQRHAEYFLEHQEEIPEVFRNYYLTFPETVWQDGGGDRRVPCLSWSGGQWYLSFSWLEDDWGSHDRLLRSRK